MIGDRWGVTEDEVRRHYPCDDVVPRPTLAVWRGVTVAAGAERVWPWLRQIRVAPYSYDRIDNLGRRSPQELLDLPEPVVGDPFTHSLGRDVGTVVAVETGRSLTGELLGTVLSYVTEPLDRHRSRLLMKLVMRGAGPIAPAVSIGDLVMARRQLLNLKQLAEG